MRSVKSIIRKYTSKNNEESFSSWKLKESEKFDILLKNLNDMAKELYGKEKFNVKFSPDLESLESRAGWTLSFCSYVGYSVSIYIDEGPSISFKINTIQGCCGVCMISNFSISKGSNATAFMRPFMFYDEHSAPAESYIKEGMNDLIEGFNRFCSEVLLENHGLVIFYTDELSRRVYNKIFKDFVESEVCVNPKSSNVLYSYSLSKVQ